MALPDLTTYQDPEVLTPPDDPEPCTCHRLTCAWCGDSISEQPYEREWWDE